MGGARHGKRAVSDARVEKGLEIRRSPADVRHGVDKTFRLADRHDVVRRAVMQLHRPEARNEPRRRSPEQRETRLLVRDLTAPQRLQPFGVQVRQSGQRPELSTQCLFGHFPHE